MKKFITICCLFALFGGLVFGFGKGESEEAVLKELLALESAALDTWYGDSDPTLYAEQFAEKATYFDPWSGGKLSDSAVKEYLMGFAGKVPKLEYKFMDPRVDLYGDTAVFTYNMEAFSPDGGPVTYWNVTLIYEHMKDGWEKIHGNFSFTVPGS